MSEFILPPYLQSGDQVAIVSPAGAIAREFIEGASSRLEKDGFKVIVTASAASKHGIFAGDDIERLTDLQWALDNPDVKMIICSRGGYGTSRIIDKIDWSGFIANPKWVVGYSDITSLLLAINSKGYASLHSIMCKEIAENLGNNLFLMKAALSGELPGFCWDSKRYIKGAAQGEIVGGNLSLVDVMLGSNLIPDLEGKILFLEEVSETAYSVDRLLTSLKLSGVFNKVSGVIFGQFTSIKETKSWVGGVGQLLLDAVKDYGIPVAFDFPAGHTDENLPVILGQTVKFTVDEEEASIEYM